MGTAPQAIANDSYLAQANQNSMTDPPSGIIFANDSIKPGDSLGQVFGIAGNPDAVEALRAKSGKVEDDYVDFVYYDQYDIRINKKNVVQSILVKSGDIRLLLNGAQLRIGDNISKAASVWGEPEREANNITMYYYRGVYLIHDDNGTIKQFFFSAPQSRENEIKKGSEKAQQTNNPLQRVTKGLQQGHF